MGVYAFAQALDAFLDAGNPLILVKETKQVSTRLEASPYHV